VNSYRKRLKQIYPDCWQWISLARRFPGQLTESEAASLFHLAWARTSAFDPVIVELGACQGKTTLLLAAGLRGKMRPLLFAFPSGPPPDPQPNFQRCRLEHIVDMMTAHPRER
jgi:hypothetical protein